MKPLCLRFILLSAFIFAGRFPVLFAQEVSLADTHIQRCVNEISADSIEASVRTLVSFQTRHNLSTSDSPEQGIGAAARWLEKKVESWIPASEGRLSVQKVFYMPGGSGSRLEREVRLCNVVATLEGTAGMAYSEGIANGSEEIVLLAHYDSRVKEDNDSTSFAPGANDNGSGVSCLLEIVRILSVNPLPVTVRCMFLSGEEHGLLGAAEMAKEAGENNRNIIAVINNDMIGNTEASQTGHRDNSTVRVFSTEGPSRELARYIKEIGERYVDHIKVRMIFRNDRYGRGGDHTPFLRAGYPSVRISEYYENYDRTHQLVVEKDGIKYGDMPEGVDFGYIRKNTSVNLASVMSLAKAPMAPVNLTMNDRELNNYTVLKWEYPAGAVTSPAGYYLLLRETDSPVWQKKIFVTQTQITVPYSKDNYIFGVQSIDVRGHTSLPCTME